MGCLYDFLPLSGLFPKATLIHNRLSEAIKADLLALKECES